MKSSNEEIVLSRDSKEFFERLFVKVFYRNWKHVEAQSQRTGTPADSWEDSQKQPPEVLYKKNILKTFAISKGNSFIWVYF